MDLDWSTYDATNKSFKAYKKTEDSDEWQSISTLDFSENMEHVKVLNVYPVVDTKVTFTFADGTSQELPKSASLKVWMEGGSYKDAEQAETTFEAYGINPATEQQILNVTLVSSDEFNADPEMIWDYDVTMFGTWDANGWSDAQQPDDDALDVIEEYIKAGNGVMGGHDTIGGYYDVGLGKLRSYFNIKKGYWGARGKEDFDIDDSWGYKSTIVEVKKNGLLTNFPWEIPVGTKLTVPSTHTTAHSAFGDVWMELVDGQYYGGNTDPETNYYSYGEGNAYYYLTTYNNTAMIQTGNSNCESTPDERKVLANALFYLKQRTNATSFTDNSSQDFKAPNLANIEIGNINTDKKIPVSFNAEDNGSTYSYYVESYDRSNSTTVLDVSNEITQTVATGIKGYYYVIDEKETNDFDVADATYIEGKEILLGLEDNTKYIHVKAVDVAGNIGAVSTKRIYLESKVTVDTKGGMLNENQDVLELHGLIGTTIDLGTPEKEGYTFLGWTVTSGTLNGTLYTFGIEPGYVVANWKGNGYLYTIYYKDKDSKKDIYPSVTDSSECGSEIKAEDKIVEIEGYKYNSSDKTSIEIGTDESKNIITLYYTKEEQKKDETIMNEPLPQTGDSITMAVVISGILIAGITFGILGYKKIK